MRRTPRPTPRSLSEDETFAQKTLAQLNAERPLGDVYFDLDNAAIKDEGRAALSTNATYLKRWPSTRINIEGHCDERGTAEYNLALGERRANAVKAYLVELGVTGDRVVIVSKGKEVALLRREERSLLAAEPPRSLHHHRKVAEIFSAASLGLAAAVMGRPITRYDAPAVIASAGVNVLA